MEKDISFEFNLTKGRKSIVQFVFLSLTLILLISFTENKISASFNEYKEIYFFLLFSYSVLILVLFRRLLKSHFSNQLKIQCTNGRFILPNFFFGEKVVSISDIYSSEPISIGRNVLGLILGITNNSRMFVDKQCFRQPEEFEVFKGLIADEIDKRPGSDEKFSINKLSISHQKKIRVVTTLLFILFLSIYFLSTSGKFDFGDDFGFVLEGGGSNRVFENFEIYRIFSSAFIHANFFHLFMNLLVLAAVGDVLEKTVSSLRFINIFFLSTLCGFFTFFLFSYDEFGAGASGGIYGLWGAYLCLKFKYEKFLPGSVNAVTLNSLMWLLALQFTLEIFVFENIGISNHLGGFVAGFLYLYFAPLGPKLETIDQPVMAEKILCGGLVLSFSAGLGYFLSLYYGLF